MMWLTWRQFRAQAIGAAIALAVMAVVLAVTRPGLVTGYTAAGLPACHARCMAIASLFIDGVGSLDHILYFGGIALAYLAPVLMGLFWGAPLIAREVETGTHRIAWNQSVTRTRWTLVKLGLVGLAAVATAGLLSLMVTWWAGPIDHAASLAGGSVQVAAGGGAGVHSSWYVLPRLDPVVFAARGVAPLGYAAFAFTLGVTAGALLRRTLPAMAVTLVAFAVIQVLVPNFVRPHLLPPARFTAPLNVQTASFQPSETVGSRAGEIQVTPQNFARPGAWVLSNAIVTPSGAGLTLPRACTSGAGGPGLAGLRACQSELATMHLRQSVAYQPASRFWPLQWTEAGIYLVLAAGLGSICVWQVCRKRAA
jgi:hypothetical protein